MLFLYSGRSRGRLGEIRYRGTAQRGQINAAVNRIASNINQICRCINSTGHFYEDDIAELKARLGDVWELLKMRQKEEL